MVIDYVRLAILRGLINYKDVEFLYKNFVIFPDKYGHLDNWPDGFCDYKDKLLEEFLKDMFTIYKEDTNATNSK